MNGRKRKRQLTFFFSFLLVILQYLRQRADFGRVAQLLGRLCKLLPTNVAYMACGHGIGHGINHFAAVESLSFSANASTSR